MKLKENISSQTNDPEQLPAVLEQLKREASGFKVPDGYFVSLSPRIGDEIKRREHTSFIKVLIPALRKPRVWAPSMATVVIAVLLIFVVPAKKETVIPVTNEWTEINMAYDASYAEEAVLAESHSLDQELEKKDINYSASPGFTGMIEPTRQEIAKYLKEHELEAELLNEY